jgi:hypothetical protein
MNEVTLAPEGENLLAKHFRLQGWLEKMLPRPSVMRTRSKYEAKGEAPVQERS